MTWHDGWTGAVRFPLHGSCAAVLVAALAGIGWSGPSRAADQSMDCTVLADPSPAEASVRGATLAGETGLTIGRVDIRAGDIFDETRPGEGRWIHDVANALHMNTRTATIAAAIRLVRGEPFSLARLAAAERELRARRFLREVVIVPVRRCGTVVDLEVRTVDNWTLTPSISFGSAGGVERYTVELQDLNVLGAGKELKLRASRSGAERERTFIYGDDNVFGRPYRFRVEAGDTEDGERYALSAGLPFLRPESPLSWWLSAGVESESFTVDAPELQVPPEDTANRVDVPVDSTRVDAGMALGRNRPSGVIVRAGGGLRVERQGTRVADGMSDDIGVTDFEEAYPYAFIARSRPDWSKRRHYLGIGRVEDIDSGLGIRLEGGALLEALGNERNGFRLAAEISRGWRPSEDSLHDLSLSGAYYLDGASGGEGVRNSFALRYQYFRWAGERDQLDLRLVAEHRPDRSPVDDLRLGGEFGLKGYPNGYQEGDERLVALVEYRHVTRWTPFALADIALSAFAEAGRAGGGESDTLADIGIGLMLSPTRSSRNDVIRFDIAVPLVDGPGVDDFLFFVGSRLTY